MVSTTEITVGESRKINTGNYENREVSIYLKANVANQDIREASTEINEKIKLHLDAREERIRSEMANQKD